MATYRSLVDADVPTRTAATLVGIPRATATRTPTRPIPRGKVVPANKLSRVERAEILTVVNSPEFVDLPPRSRSTPNFSMRAPIWPRSQRFTTLLTDVWVS